MRIAYIINSVEGGGAALPVPSVVEVLRKGGADVRVLALMRRDGRALPPMESAGLDVRVREGGRRDHLAALRWLEREVRGFGATHLWTSLTRATLLGQIVGKRLGLPVVSWQHAAWLKPGNRRLLRARQRLSRLWVGDSETVTRLTAERLGVPRERLVQWSIFRADPSAPQAAPWRQGELIRIGSLGRLHRVKGYDMLVEALRRLPADLPPYEVTIAGDGAECEALREQARRAGVTTLRFAGYTTDSRGFLAGLHLYAQPSRSEGLCVAAHEAMQAGLPLVASAVGELPNSIREGETGMLVPPQAPQALADALVDLLTSPERLAAMGQAARATVLDHFGPERFEATGLAIVERMRGF